jgi:hypothetical protein
MFETTVINVGNRPGGGPITEKDKGQGSGFPPESFSILGTSDM